MEGEEDNKALNRPRAVEEDASQPFVQTDKPLKRPREDKEVITIDPTRAAAAGRNHLIGRCRIIYSSNSTNKGADCEDADFLDASYAETLFGKGVRLCAYPEPKNPDDVGRVKIRHRGISTFRPLSGVNGLTREIFLNGNQTDSPPSRVQRPTREIFPNGIASVLSGEGWEILFGEPYEGQD